MAKLVLKECYIGVGAGPTDLSDRCRSISLETSADIVDATCFTDAWKDRLAGLLDWKVSLEFAQDYAAGSVDDIFFPLLGTTFLVTLRPTQAVAGADNPEYSGTGILESYNPLDGKVSDLGTAKVSILAAGVLGRAVT
jgi:hypothetical protein